MNAADDLCNPVTLTGLSGTYAEWPIGLGRKGPSWFLVFDRPRGMRFQREHIVLNTLDNPEPFPPSSPEGHPRFLFFCPLEPDTLRKVLLAARTPALGGDAGGSPLVRATGRDVGGGAQEMEVLLKETQIFHACANCEKWEAMRRPRFLRCSSCKVRYYCSRTVRRCYGPAVRSSVLMLVSLSANISIGPPSTRQRVKCCRLGNFYKQSVWSASTEKTWIGI